MKHLCTKGILLAFLFALMLGMGCNRNSPPPTPLTLEELPGAMAKAFSTAKPQAKDLAAEVVSSVQAQDYSKALLAIQTLASVPNLTKEQVRIRARGDLTIRTLLDSAQARGDQRAAQTLKYIHDNK